MGKMTRGLLVVLLFVPAAVAAQLSPGKLSQPHAKLEGSTNCLKCHQTGKGVAPSRCLDCHTALKSRIAAGRGLHARPEYRPCQTCHIEHNGREFQLVYWGKPGQKAFDHRLTGWPLEGAHARQACQSCHRPEKKTFLGLGSACVSCHKDEHRGQFAPRGCLSCHTITAWKPPAKFDHAKTGFPLTGQHKAVACASCHPKRSDKAGEFAAFKGIQHQSCSSCHKDAHQGRLGAICQQCHSTTGWQAGSRAKLDHDRTRFPLRGLHQKVGCQACHTSGRSLRFTRFQSCGDCHRNVHAGQITPSKTATCESCHTVAGFSPSTFTLERHQKTGYPLEGAHLAVPCVSCHRKNASGVIRFKWESTACQSCHGDPHEGQLAQAGCQSCHSVQGWARVTFDHDRHSRFKLEGAHARLPCAACHRPESRDGRTVVRFKPLPVTCEGCHGSRTPANTRRVS
jgi:hypothetical protein